MQNPEEDQDIGCLQFSPWACGSHGRWSSPFCLGLAGQKSSKLCLSLSHNAGVTGSGSTAQPFPWMLEIQTSGFMSVGAGSPTQRTSPYPPFIFSVKWSHQGIILYTPRQREGNHLNRLPTLLEKIKINF